MIQQLSMFARRARITGTSTNRQAKENPAALAATATRSTSAPAFLAPQDIPSPTTTIIVRLSPDPVALIDHQGLAVVDTRPFPPLEAAARYLLRAPSGALLMELGDRLAERPTTHALVGRVVRFVPGATGLRYVRNLRAIGAAKPRASERQRRIAG